MNENKFNDHKNKNKNYNNSNNLSDKKYNNDNNNYNDDDIIEENQNSDNDKAYINNEVHTFNESGNGNANNETQVTKIQQLIEEYDDQENDISKILDSQKKKSANERCYLLYNKGKIKNEVNRLMFKKNSELKEKQELSQCTFKPKLNVIKKVDYQNQIGRLEDDTYKRNVTWKLRNNER